MECQVIAPFFFLGSFSASCSSAEPAGLLSDGRVDPGGMVERSIKRERRREGGRLLDRRAEPVLPGPGLSSDIYNKRLTTTLIYWNPLPSLTSQLCWKRGVNKENQSNAPAESICRTFTDHVSHLFSLQNPILVLKA